MSARSKPLDWITDRTARTLISGLHALPYQRRVAAMGKTMERVLGPVTGYQKRALENLARIYPEMAPPERLRIARAVLNNVGRSLIESYSPVEFQGQLAQADVAGAGLAEIERAERDGRPVILVTGHYGNWEAARGVLKARGLVTGGLYRPMSNPYFNSHYVEMLNAFGNPCFPQGPSGISGFVRHLRSGGRLLILFDLHVYKAPVLEFLGHPANTATSAADMALRYEALLIPVWTERREDGVNFKVTFDAPLDVTAPEDTMQGLNDQLGARIERDPAQWFWVHRRWKAAPF